jgi:hypothetical protein
MIDSIDIQYKNYELIQENINLDNKINKNYI